MEKRKIKFRAWDTDKKYMLGKIFDNTIEGEDWYFPKLRDKFIVMQYAGLEDVTGREIYEDDMIECTSRGIFIVKFLCGAFYCVNYLSEARLLLHFADSIVIGHNYEDDFRWKPDLDYVEFRLKEKQKNKVENWF